jgi:glutamate/tyrosine decarboxylase-like PLP-dependent enzyme
VTFHPICGPLMRDLLTDTTNRALRYLDDLARRRVAPPPDAVAALAALDEPLPDAPTDPARVIELLDRVASPATITIPGPRFFGFVAGGVLPAALAANWLAGTWDQNTVYMSVTPATSMLERVALRWMLEILGLPAECGGAFVTGATIANFSALAAARRSVLARVGWDVEGDGLTGAPPITVIVAAEVHPSVTKSLGLLGLGRRRVVTVPADTQGRMRADLLPRVTGPTIICTQVGNVNTGACDPVAEICARVKQTGAWVHVDGAFGIWAAAAPERAHLVAGVAAADSWATDAHKWLNVPFDCGLAFVRDAEALRAAMAVTAEYLPPSGSERNPGEYTPELSRRARGVEVWAALRSLGRQGLAHMIETNCRLARRFADGLAAHGYEILNDVVLNQVLVSFGEPAVTNRVIKELQADGTCWCGGTVWQGRTAMRISVSNFRTTDDDVDRSLAAMLRIAARERAR